MSYFANFQLNKRQTS